MKARFYVGRTRVPRLLYDYLSTERQTGVVRDLLAWTCAAIAQVFIKLARMHLETGLWLAGGSRRLWDDE